MLATEPNTMAKQRPVGRPKEDGPGKPVRLSPELVTKAKFVALSRDEPMSEYLARILEPVVERDYRALAKKLGEEAK
jgi:hypothetical protein